MTYPFQADMAAHGRWASLRETAPTQIQVMGERASGTNAIRKIIELNTSLKHTAGLGWKHGFPHMVAIPAKCLVLCAVRAPEAWALSMHKRPWHAHPDLQTMGFSEFIRAEWRSIMDKRGHFEMLAKDIAPKGELLQHDRHPITGAAFDNLFALRSAKLASLAGFANRGCSVAFVQMEGAMSDTEGFVTWLCAQTEAGRTTESLKLPARRMGNLYKRSVETAPETPKAMSVDDRAFMQSALDAEIEAAFGYANEG